MDRAPHDPGRLQSPQIVGVLPNGKFVGTADDPNQGAFARVGFVWDTLTDTSPTPLAVLSGLGYCGGFGVSSGGEIWASCYDAEREQQSPRSRLDLVDGGSGHLGRITDRPG